MSIKLGVMRICKSKGDIGVLSGNGGDEGARTPDLGIANAALSQLSYIPIGPIKFFLITN